MVSTQVERRAEPVELGLPGLMELASGYQRAQVLFVASELGLFRALATGLRSVAEVAEAMKAPTRGVEALLDACVAMNLVRRSADGYENSRTAGLFLSGTEMTFGSALRFWQRFSYDIWGRLAEAIRQGRPQSANGTRGQDLFDWLVTDDARLRLFFDGLASLAYWPARKLATLVDLSRRTHLLDVGGGDGAVSEVLATRYPHLRVTLFDREAVCSLARERFDRLGAGDRLVTVPGDFHRDRLPSGPDCVLLSNVLHDWSPEECRALLAKVHAVLPREGEVIVHDFLPPERGRSREACLFELALVLDTERGKVYTADEVRAWLETAGFHQIREAPVTPATGLLVGVKAG